MNFPLNLLDLSLLFSLTALILLITSGLIASQHSTKILINTKKLNNVAMLFAGLFMVTVVLQIFYALITY